MKMRATHETVQIRLDGIPDHCRLRGGFSGDYGGGGEMSDQRSGLGCWLKNNFNFLHLTVDIYL